MEDTQCCPDLVKSFCTGCTGSMRPASQAARAAQQGRTGGPPPPPPPRCCVVGSSPAAGKSKPRLQPDSGSPRLVTAMSPWKPPGHWLVTLYSARQPVAAAEADGSRTAREPTAVSRPAAASETDLSRMGPPIDG